MKKTFIIFAIAVLALTSCGGGKMDYATAKACAESCLKAIDQGDFAAVSENYYSSEFAGNSKEDLSGKFTRLKETTGAMSGFSLKDSSMTTEIGEEAKITLTYEVMHANTNTTEQFVIVDQGGKYKIVNHSINN